MSGNFTARTMGLGTDTARYTQIVSVFYKYCSSRINIVKQLERKVGLCLHYWRVVLILKRSMKPLLYLVIVDPWMDEFVDFLLLK